LTYDLDVQVSILASYGHDLNTYKNSKFKGQSVQQTEWKQMHERTLPIALTFPADAVGKSDNGAD